MGKSAGTKAESVEKCSRCNLLVCTRPAVRKEGRDVDRKRDNPVAGRGRVSGARWHVLGVAGIGSISAPTGARRVCRQCRLAGGCTAQARLSRECVCLTQGTAASGQIEFGPQKCRTT